MICQSDENAELTSQTRQEDESSLLHLDHSQAELQGCSTPCDKTPGADADAAAVSTVDSRHDAAEQSELTYEQGVLDVCNCGASSCICHITIIVFVNLLIFVCTFVIIASTELLLYLTVLVV